MIEWKIVKKKISQLKPFATNPRTFSTHDAKALKESLSKFGLIDKPVITEDDNIIGGHQRLQILKQLGKKEVECYQAQRNLSEEEVKELNIRLNRTGDFDFDILANEYEIDQLKEWGFEDYELGIYETVDPIDDDHVEKKKDLKKCPACGHEF